MRCESTREAYGSVMLDSAIARAQTGGGAAPPAMEMRAHSNDPREATS